MAPIVTSLATLINQFGIAAVTSAGDGPVITYTGASGGVISDYLDGATRYRAHIFTSSGTFTVTDPAIASVEYLVVAGGGGGGASQGGGAGAGGLRTNLSGHPLATGNPSFTVTGGPTIYTVTVGSGGVGYPSIESSTPAQPSQQGNDSYFGPPSTPLGITSKGGGGGGSYGGGATGAPGGSGGAASGGPGPYVSGYGYNPSTPSPVLSAVPLPSPYGITQGNNGGNRAGGVGAGGGGAGSVGGDGVDSSSAGNGGAGVQVAIAGPASATTGVGALNPGPGQYQWFAGGGGGGPSNSGSGGTGGVGGGAAGSGLGAGPAPSATYATGGGGGGGGTPYTGANGGNGGSGIVIVRYQLPASTGTAKATGGLISFFGGKTIHTFTSSGVFNVTNGPIDVSYVVVAGGGSGGFDGGGGGGAGGVLTNIPGLMPTTQPSLTLSNGPVAVQVGAGGASISTDSQSPNGSDSYFGAPRTATGGGGGGYNLDGNGRPGGSGGGERINRSLSAGNGTPGQGNPGFNDIPGSSGGGGGGAGTGGPGTDNDGGAGVQMPSIFRNPTSGVGFPGPGGGGYWVAGGGGGYGGSDAPKGGGPGGPYAGAGNGGGPGGEGAFGPLSNARQNSGSGGGGGSGISPPYRGGAGGSGIVLIAYPT